MPGAAHTHIGAAQTHLIYVYGQKPQIYILVRQMGRPKLMCENGSNLG